MGNGKVVHYKKVYKIVIEGKSDTALPDEPPLALTSATKLIEGVVEILDNQYKWRDVRIKELKR